MFAAAFADVGAQLHAAVRDAVPGRRRAGSCSPTPDDLLNTGIEVEAKPAGKNVKKLSLLSGGERSAHRAGVPVRRVPQPAVAVLRDGRGRGRARRRQPAPLPRPGRTSSARRRSCIVVSHQKRTMEAGDCLLGVTMQPGGSSKVVTERASTVIGHA